MEYKELKTLRNGEYVTVKSWAEIKDFAPEIMKRFCGNAYKISHVYTGYQKCALEERDGTIISTLFDMKVLDKTDLGSLYVCAPSGKKKPFGKIGEKTGMIDFDGRPLYVGDIVNVSALNKELRDNDDDDPFTKILKKIGQMTFISTVCKDDESGGFVMGLANCYNDNEQNTDEYKVVKIVDYSAVMNGAIIEKVIYEKKIV